MRIRSIRPEYWTSEDIATMTWDARLVYIGLWSYVDDNGVGRDVEPIIASELFPFDMAGDSRETLAKVSGALATLSSGGQIVRYESNGKPYFHVVAWKTHQRIDKPGKDRYPLPTTEDAIIRETVATPSRDSRDISTPGEGEKRRRGEEEEGRRERVTRAHKLPDGWQPKPETITAMASELPNVNLKQEHVKFADHYTANGKAMKDWDACWRNWMRRATGYAQNTRQTRQQETDDLFAAAARRMGVTPQPLHNHLTIEGTVA